MKYAVCIAVGLAIGWGLRTRWRPPSCPCSSSSSPGMDPDVDRDEQGAGVLDAVVDAVHRVWPSTGRNFMADDGQEEDCCG